MKPLAIVLVAILFGVGCGKDSDRRGDSSVLAFTQAPQLVDVLIAQPDGSQLQGKAISGCLANVSEVLQVRIRVTFHSDFEGGTEELQQEKPTLSPGEEWCFMTNGSPHTLTAFHLTELTSATWRLPGT